jgi:sarcosine/dimethylglycine N-methyltransferase
MATTLITLDANSRVLDLGAGYGGAARYLAEKYGCQVTCLNLSETQNERNRLLNKEHNLADKISVLHGSFENVPCDNDSFDIVWSQDAFLHSGDRPQILREIDRLLITGGEIVFTDPMQIDSCDTDALQPVYDRLDLESLSSTGFYQAYLGKLGFKELSSNILTDQLGVHYSAVRQQILDRYEELIVDISPAYLDKMITGLQSWINAKEAEQLVWGVLHYKR